MQQERVNPAMNPLNRQWILRGIRRELRKVLSRNQADKVWQEAGSGICHMDKAYMQGFRHIRYERASAVSESAACCDYRLRFDTEKH